MKNETNNPLHDDRPDNDPLRQVFELLQVPSARPKLGPPPAGAGREDRRPEAEAAFRANRRRVQSLLRQAARGRGQTVRWLNGVLFAIIGCLVASIVTQFLTDRAGLLAPVQAACTGVILPLAFYIVKNANTQAHIEFVAVFLTDLEAEDAIKAIEQLFLVVNHPGALTRAVGTAKSGDAAAESAQQEERLPQADTA